MLNNMGIQGIANMQSNWDTQSEIKSTLTRLASKYLDDKISGKIIELLAVHKDDSNYKRMVEILKEFEDMNNRRNKLYEELKKMECSEWWNCGYDNKEELAIKSLFHIEDKKNDISNYISDIITLKAACNWSPEHILEEVNKIIDESVSNIENISWK